MVAPKVISALVTRYRDNRDDYRSAGYKEFRLRREFIDPFFEALGWDVSNRGDSAEAYKEVIHEDSLKIGEGSKAPDYAFRIGGTRKFFVETKPPITDVKHDTSPAYQLRRYGWSAKLPLSILTDFEEFAVYDCRIRPKPNDRASMARVLFVTYDEYESRWHEIEGVFGRDSIRKGAFDRYAQDATRKKGTAEVDAEFLADIESWRENLAKNIALRNRQLNVHELNAAVQRTIDRIIFLRIAEDRGFEAYAGLRRLATGPGVYANLVELFRYADERYNSGLFHFRRGDGSEESLDTFTLGLTIDDKPLRDILTSLYFPESPYEFSVIPIEILGQIYEQFLGKVIRLAGKSAVVDDKPEARKAHGVFYTPTYISQYIVSQTLGRLIEGRTPAQISGVDKRYKSRSPVSVLDPACGSGSFLIEAYRYLLNWYLESYIADGPKKHASGREPKLHQIKKDGWQLTIAEKGRILLAHIFGVDIDPQAVEVTKLSLLMQVLEDEKGDSLAAQMNFFHMRALPDLGKNIKCGNSLVGTDVYSQQLLHLNEEDERRINPFNWDGFIKEITQSRGFDIIVGNPPYVLLQDKNRQSILESYFASHYSVAAYKVDTYHLFLEKALQLLASDGLMAFICPSNCLTNNHAVALRNVLVRDHHLTEIVNFQGRVFQRASVDTCILEVDRRTTADNIRFLNARPDVASFTVTSDIRLPVKRIVADPRHLISATSAEEETLINAIAEKGGALGRIANVNFGKQLRDRKKFTRDVIQASPRNETPRGYARCYTGRDVQKFALSWSGLLCRTDRVAQAGGCWDEEKQNAKLKLLCKQIGRYPAFAVDECGYQCLNTIFMVNLVDSEDAYYLLGLLNSRLLQYFWLKRFYDHRVTFPKIKGTYLKQLPIRSREANRRLAEKVDGLARDLTARQSKVNSIKLETERATTTQAIQHLERELNAAVFSLYEISDAQAQRISNLMEKNAET
jgi:predicted type IV restriction endonuclease